MKAILKEPGMFPKLVDIPNTLEALQEAVDGYIECLTIDDGVCVICNEEGRLNGLPYNIVCGRQPLVGNILLVGTAGEEFAELPATWCFSVIKECPELWYWIIKALEAKEI